MSNPLKYKEQDITHRLLIHLPHGLLPFIKTTLSPVGHRWRLPTLDCVRDTPLESGVVFAAGSYFNLFVAKESDKDANA